jgi:chromosome segregation ATPase
MNSSDRLDRIEAILAATAVQQQANTEALTRLEAQTFANSEAIGRLEVQTLANATAIDRLTERFDHLTDRVDRLAQRFDGLVSAIGSHQEALRLISQQHNEWREQMRIIQTEIRDIWQYLNNQLRNRGNGGGQN